MEIRQIVKHRRAMLLTGTMLAAFPLTAAVAADQAALVEPPASDVNQWYFFGGFEAGNRFVFDQPPTGFGRAPGPAFWLTPLTTDSRAKFWEYGEVRSGPFLDWLNLQTGTKDGRFAFDFWARNVGRDNQSYEATAANIGSHYFTAGWDQTPHTISTSAKVIFGGVGSTTLTVPDPVQAALQAQLPNAAATTPAGATARGNIENIINGSVNPLALGTQRNNATADYRFTPTPDIDLTVNYGHEDRTGLRPTGVSYGYTAAAAPGSAIVSSRPTNPVEIPQLIDDTTQNVAARGEYVGTTLWSTRWSTSVKYAGSFYDDHVNRMDIENPFCFTCTLFTGNINRGPDLLRLAAPPSNNANAVTWNTAVDLPFWKSRYVSTVQYNMMRQNDAFVDTGTNGLVMPAVTLLGLPVNSLDGRVDTFLWNNVYTAQITSDVKTTLRGRHYDIDNRTPSLHIDNWLFGDSGCAAGAPSAFGICPATSPRNSLPISYTKDNASAETSWRAARWVTFGGGFFWERYDRHFRDVNVTDEFAGKGFVDITPIEYVHARASYMYAERRYDTYDTREFVEEFGIQFSEVAENLRRFDVANRNRHKADALLEWTPGSIVTISPNAGLRWDDYPDDVFNPLGVRSDHSWNAGVEVAAMFNSTLKFLASYNYEDRKLEVAGGSGGANFITGNLLTGCPTDAGLNPDAVIGTGCTWRSDVHQRYHTFMGAADWKVVPSRLDLRFEYLHSRATEANATAPCPAPSIIGATAVGTNCNGLATVGAPPVLVDPATVNFGQFPTERNTFQRFNVIGKYYVDPSVVRQMGWTGDVTLKVRYTAERNQNNNWATDNMTPYVPTADTTELTGASRSVFLAAFNPNYMAQLVALSVQVKW
jgi:MtrB/PioB family decaheme-associated outer membrane protein